MRVILSSSWMSWRNSAMEQRTLRYQLRLFLRLLFIAFSWIKHKNKKYINHSVILTFCFEALLKIKFYCTSLVLFVSAVQSYCSFLLTVSVYFSFNILSSRKGVVLNLLSQLHCVWVVSYGDCKRVLRSVKMRCVYVITTMEWQPLLNRNMIPCK